MSDGGKFTCFFICLLMRLSYVLASNEESLAEEKAYPRIAVCGIVFFEDEVLFLKRNFQPYLWCPPCGGLRKNEKLLDGLRREIREEAGIEVEPALPVHVWQGCHDDEEILSITYTCKAFSRDIRLSREHSDFRWIPIKSLSSFSDQTDFDVSKWSIFLKLHQMFLSGELSI